MRRLIRADLRRILTKKGFWIFFAITLVVVFFDFEISISSLGVKTGIIALCGANAAFDIAGFMISLIGFSALYCDDFRCMSMIPVIGRGLTRDKIVSSKMIVTVIMTFLMYGITALMIYLIGLVECEAMNAEQMVLFIYSLISKTVGTIIVITLASVFLYITSKIPVSIFVMLVLQVIGNLASGFLSGFARRYINMLYFTEIISSAQSDFVLGARVEAVFTLIACFVCYMAVSFVIIHFTFGKKELDF